MRFEVFLFFLVYLPFAILYIESGSKPNIGRSLSSGKSLITIKINTFIHYSYIELLIVILAMGCHALLLPKLHPHC